jgi:AcrR family transcriptional regulator
MSRKRLTREDSRERTAQRLLAAARKLIAKRGLSDTTLDEIAEEAGYTRGAFYSNFSSKGDLFIELLRRDHEATSAQLRALRDDSLPLEHIQQRIRGVYSQIYRTNDTFMNWTEARMLAARRCGARGSRRST